MRRPIKNTVNVVCELITLAFFLRNKKTPFRSVKKKEPGSAYFRFYCFDPLFCKEQCILKKSRTTSGASVSGTLYGEPLGAKSRIGIGR
jgi:hypothetical protein